LSHEAFLRNARNSEETLRKEAIERTDLSHLDGTSVLSPVDTSPDSMYQVESTGAVVSLNSAVGLIHFYCSQLPSDRYKQSLLFLLFLGKNVFFCENRKKCLDRLIFIDT
jgi:endoribonuclease Dicer